MLGKRSDQLGLFEADHLYLDFVGRDTFYGFLASQRGQMFHDEEFAALYVLDNGCPSVPPSLLATALLLQTYDRVSDEEAKARADFDLRWKGRPGRRTRGSPLRQEHPAAVSLPTHLTRARASSVQEEPVLRSPDWLPQAS